MLRPTQTHQLLVLVLELVVIRDLLARHDVTLREEQNLVLVVYVHHTRVAVRVATVVDEPTLVPLHRRVHDVLRVQSEEVTPAHLHLLVHRLARVRHLLTHHLAHELHHHHPLHQRTAREQAPALDRTLDHHRLLRRAARLTLTHTPHTHLQQTVLSQQFRRARRLHRL